MAEQEWQPSGFVPTRPASAATRDWTPAGFVPEAPTPARPPPMVATGFTAPESVRVTPEPFVGPVQPPRPVTWHVGPGGQPEPGQAPPPTMGPSVGLPQLARGARVLGERAASAVRELAHPQVLPPEPHLMQARGGPLSTETKAALSDVIEGAFQTVAPAVLVGGAVVSPLGTAANLIVSSAAAKAAEGALRAVGADEESQRLAGDLASAVVGSGVAIGVIRRAIGKAATDAHAVLQEARTAGDVTEIGVKVGPLNIPLARAPEAPLEPPRPVGRGPGMPPEAAAEPPAPAPRPVPPEGPEGVPYAPPPLPPAAAPAGEVPPYGGPERVAPAGGRVQPESLDPGSPEERGISRTEVRDVDPIRALVDDARAGGFRGDEAALGRELTDRLALIQELDADFDASSGHSPQVLLRAMAQAGGLSVPRETTLQGELRWLKEFRDQKESSSRRNLLAPPVWADSIQGVRGVFRERGLTVDGMLEALQQDPKFQHLESVNDLLNEIHRAASAGPTPDAARRLRQGLGERWWEQMLAPATEDVLETGEVQPRLPAAEGVREAEQPTPVVADVPFALEREIDDAARAFERDLFSLREGREPGEEEPSFSVRSAEQIRRRALADRAELQWVYESLPTHPALGPHTPIYDGGQRLSPDELTEVLNPGVQQVVARLMHTTAVVLGRLGVSRVERVGLILDDRVYGANFPHPTTGRSTILLNPFEGLVLEPRARVLRVTPPEAAAKTGYETIVHEAVHDRVEAHGPRFDEAYEEALTSLGPQFQIQTHRALQEAYADPSAPTAIRPEIARALSLYTSSRGRPAVAPDPLGRAGGYAPRPTGRPGEPGAPPGGVRGDRARTVTRAELQRLADRQGTTLGEQVRRAEAAGYTVEARAGEAGAIRPELLVPEAVAKEVRRTRSDLLTLFLPTAAGPSAPIGAGVLRAQLAARAQRLQRAYRTLEHLERSMDDWSHAQALGFWDVMEGRAKPATLAPPVREVASLYRQILDTKRGDVLRRGLLRNYLEHYWGHEWVRPPTTLEATIRRLFGRRPLAGPESYRRHRKIPTMREGIETFQLEPVSWNPTTQLLRKLVEMEKSITAYDIRQDLKATGQAKFVAVGQRAPEGWRRYPESFGTVYGRPFVTIKEAFDPALLEGLEKLATDLGIKLGRKVKIGGQRWGYAVTEPPGREQVVTKVAGPETVLMHEIGHVLDTRYGLADRMVKDKEFKKELRALADLRYEGEDVPTSFKKYVRKGPEKIANLVHAYLYAPERARAVAPQSMTALETLVRRHPELAALKTLQSTRSLKLGQREYETRIPGKLIAGYYHGPSEVVRLVENHLSPGLRGRLGVYDLYRGFGNFLVQFKLGYSAFHAVLTGMQSVVSKQAVVFEQLARGELREALKTQAEVPAAPVLGLIRGGRALKTFYERDASAAVIDGIVGEVVQAGGGFGWSLFEQTGAPRAFLQALRRVRGAVARGEYGPAVSQSTKAALLTIPAMTEAAMKPVMEWWVPRLKMAAFLDMARMELRALGPQPDLQETRRVLGGVWDSVDNRFGQLRYDNLFWRNALKDTLMASVQSVGWNVGSIREMFGVVPAQVRQAGLSAAGGGFGKPPTRVTHVRTGPEGEPIYEAVPESRLHRKTAWLLAEIMVYGLAGGILMYLLTGKRPAKVLDYYFPENGDTTPDGRPSRSSIAGYIKDYVAIYMRGPLAVARGKVHPALELLADTWRNEDFFGTEIRNPDDPLVRQIADVARFIVGEFQPIAVESIRRHGTKGGIESALGLPPAPAAMTRTPAERYLYSVLPPAHRTQLEAARAETRRDVRQAIREGRGPEALEAARAGGLSPRALRATIRTARGDALTQLFARATFPHAVHALALASPEERQRVWPQFVRKVHNALAAAGSVDERGRVMADYRRLAELPRGETREPAAGAR